MNINFTIINEFLAFLCFFYISLKILFPILLNNINKILIEEYKNFIFNNQNKNIEKNFLNIIIKHENSINNKLKVCFENTKKIILLEKKFFIDFIKLEKDNLLKIIKKRVINDNIILIKNLIFEIKKIFLKSFKYIYNEIINYNNEFIINYD